MKHKKLIKWLALIVWLIIIFLFSQQPHSGEATHSIIEQLLPNLKTNNIVDIINFIIRKLAHLTEYFILTLLTISLLKEYTKQEKIILISSLLFCFLYALSDEYHQSFIAGRGSSMKDVLIDTLGGIFASLSYIIYKYKRNKEAK